MLRIADALICYRCRSRDTPFLTGTADRAAERRYRAHLLVIQLPWLYGHQTCVANIDDIRSCLDPLMPEIVVYVFQYLGCTVRRETGESISYVHVGRTLVSSKIHLVSAWLCGSKNRKQLLNRLWGRLSFDLTANARMLIYDLFMFQLNPRALPTLVVIPSQLSNLGLTSR
jgi:hypothetical protein